MRMGETRTVSKRVAVLAVLDLMPREPVINRFCCQRGRLSRMRTKTEKSPDPQEYPQAPNNSGCTAGRSRAPVLPQLLSRGEIEMVRMFLS